MVNTVKGGSEHKTGRVERPSQAREQFLALGGSIRVRLARVPIRLPAKDSY